jgi:PAS domain-containing protein
MSDHALEATRLMDLRLRAATRLGGTGAAGESAGRAASSLAVLHALASSPATALDALAVLHELQVHQIELDLQAEELRESRAELEAALRRQVELYDFQPVACFGVDRLFVIREVNQAGARMLDVDHDGARGLGLDTFIAADSPDSLQRLVGRIGDGRPASGTLKWRRSRQQPEREVRADVGDDPSGHGYFVVLTNLEGPQRREALQGLA